MQAPQRDTTTTCSPPVTPSVPNTRPTTHKRVAQPGVTIIGIAGPPCSGKTTFAQYIGTRCGVPVISPSINVYGDDAGPISMNLSGILADWKKGQDRYVATNNGDFERIVPGCVIIVDYMYLLQRDDPSIDLKIFIKCEPDIALIRLLRRNNETNTPEDVIETYESMRRDEMLSLTEQYADIVVANNDESPTGLKVGDLLSTYIADRKQTKITVYP